MADQSFGFRASEIDFGAQRPIEPPDTSRATIRPTQQGARLALPVKPPLPKRESALPSTPQPAATESLAWRAKRIKDVRLDSNEKLLAALVEDDPEHLYKHKNQVAAVTNKRLLFVRYTGISSSFENSYSIVSIDIRTVNCVQHKTHAALGGLAAGLILIAFGIGIIYMALQGEIYGPGVIYWPLVMIVPGAALSFGLKRRKLKFETTRGKYEWISGPLAFRKTAEVAERTARYFDLDRKNVVNGTEAWLNEQDLALATDDVILWYHYVVAVLVPFVAVLWGILNLARGRRRSGWVLLLGPVWFVVLMFVLRVFLG